MAAATLARDLGLRILIVERWALECDGGRFNPESFVVDWTKFGSELRQFKVENWAD